MARSTRLITASYILSFVAANAPQRLRTETIAKWVKTHPTRVRHIVSQLVKAGILKSYRGATGGLALDRSPNEITLREVYDAVQGSPLIAEGIDNPFSGWQDHCKVHGVFTDLFADIETNIRSQLEQVTLDKMFVPFGRDYDVNEG
ncbi:RrF2 family transcriptional regulator [Aestuariirhabdus sp. LZHN29]|uniref:RrF2 family transcriptional regulator n=1 Tax=Aestuariirhabdus sp. LZHN29 TaxID=3417462 RepID=UPI003CF338AD